MGLAVKKFLSLIITLLFSTTAFGEVVFEDDFDAHSDWSPTQQSSSIDSESCSVGDCSIPDGYGGWRLGGGEGNNNTLNIGAANARGGTGKAFTIWDESVGGYVNDGLLDIALDEDGYYELFVRFYLKFQSGWLWDADASTGHKFLHVTHYDPLLGSTRYDFFHASQNKPRYVFQLDRYNSGTSDVAAYNMHSRLGTSTTTDYPYFPPDGNYNGTGTDFFDAVWIQPDHGMIGDTEWHCWVYRVKMNSASGVSDGEQEFWVDGIQIAETTDITWVTGETPEARRWNYVWLGGNVDNDFSGDRADEQWYALDDVVVSTHYTGMPASPASLAVESTESGKVDLDWAAGTNNADFPLDGYLIYYGDSAEVLDSDVDVGLATEWQISGLVPSQTYFFAVTAYNQAVYDAEANESIKSDTESVEVSGVGGGSPSTYGAGTNISSGVNIQ